MTGLIVNRTLWFQDGRERKIVDQNFLATASRSFVVLGEAGMGKSTLLNQFKGQAGYEVCTARALINAPDTVARFGGAQTIVVDALDEVSAGQQGDAVDLVLNRLGVLGYPRFILSCRVADWRSATALQGLSDLYGEGPIELYLEPLDRQDAVDVLSQSLGRDAAEKAAVSLEDQGLAALWSNPQTLSLIREVLGHGNLPTSRGGLFEAATGMLRKEHRDAKIGAKLVSLGEVAVLDAAGAAFATLILTGQEAVTLRVNAYAEDVPLSEIAELPKAGAIRDVLDSRLFVALGSDRFTYAHRSIGEFLGARWLSRCADTPRKQRRLLNLFNAPNLVPASLRGLHAWIAWHSPDLAGDIIAANPMGVIQYGDGDKLTLASAERLLDALEALAAKDPWFRDWSEYRLAGLAQFPLLPRLKAIITSSDREFGLRLLILQAVKGSAVLPTLANELEALILAPDNRLLRRGLDRGYVEFVEETRAPRGKLLLDEIVKGQTLRRGAVVCAFDDLTVDVLHNRLIKGTALLLAQANGLEKTLAHNLRLLARRMDGVTSARPQTSQFGRVQLSRNTGQYGPLLKLCELIIRNLLPEEDGDASRFASILDDAQMSKVFEDFLRSFYRLEQQRFHSVRVEGLKWDGYSVTAAGVPHLPGMITDITLRSKERTVVIDAKFYKDALAGGLGVPKVHSGNLYQMLAYLQHTAKGVTTPVDGILIYPLTGPPLRLHYRLLGFDVQVVTIDLTQPWQAIHNDLLDLLAFEPASAHSDILAA